MIRLRHVRSLTPANHCEVLGPAEGQYVTTFQDSMDTGCTDTFAFEMTGGPQELCVAFTPVDPPAGAAILIHLYSYVECMFVDEWYAVWGEDVCFPDLPAGEYQLFIQREAADQNIPYTLTIGTEQPVINADQVQDESCDGWSMCM